MRYTALALIALGAIACGRKDDVLSSAPAASSPAEPEPPPPPTVWHYAVAADGTAHVDMQGAKQHIQGDTTASMGSLDVVGTDLSRTKGSVLIDLASLSTHTFGNGDDDAQTKRAREWLETGQQQMRWASLAIRSIDSLSASDLTKVAPVRDGMDDVRTVTMTVHGDLLLHGSKVQEDCPIEVRFRSPAGAAPDVKPVRMQIQSKEPIRVALKDVAVQPRDAKGKATAWTADLLSKVAPTADITVNLVATPTK